MRNATREELLDLGTPITYPAHRALLQQGDESRHVLLITKGVVKVVASAESGYDMLLAVRIAGELVGEMAAFEERPRSGTVVACSDVTARIIQVRTLETFLSAHPDAMRAILHMLSARLRWANRRRIDFQAYDSLTRLARVLAELSQAYAQSEPDGDGRRCALGVTLTQRELASLAGLALNTAEKSATSVGHWLRHPAGSPSCALCCLRGTACSCDRGAGRPSIPRGRAHRPPRQAGHRAMGDFPRPR
ncbi:Crp/Fnr family transcriptional regulator [Streptomyces sp. NPDC102270]|uniref:Crp/Fnr family transcriptional regulator n=1 Tax=Streptomyces sp. NPDC102270 TaxID=3366150 RepID=UPI0038168170